MPVITDMNDPRRTMASDRMRVRRDENRNPLQSASVTDGQVRLKGPGARFLVEEGFLEVQNGNAKIVLNPNTGLAGGTSAPSFQFFSVLAGDAQTTPGAIYGGAGAINLWSPRRSTQNERASRFVLADDTILLYFQDSAQNTHPNAAHFYAYPDGFWDIGGDTNAGRAHMVGYADGAWDAGGSRGEGKANVYGGADGGWGLGNTTAYIITGPTGPVQVVGGLDVFGTKNFVMPHPTKPDHLLRHGATESPVSGTEYTGRATLDFDGEAVVTLPDYFEALNKPEGRTAFVTAVGKPFPTGASDVVDGKLTVYGNPGQDVCWIVKAERRGADFSTEEPGAISEPPPEPEPLTMTEAP